MNQALAELASRFALLGVIAVGVAVTVAAIVLLLLAVNHR